MSGGHRKPRTRAGYRRPLSRADELHLRTVLEAQVYDEAEVHHGDQWKPSLDGAGADAFTAATRRTLAFLTAWGLKQREVDSLVVENAEQRVRADIGQELAKHWRAAEHATHQLLGRAQHTDPPTVELRIARGH